ncbi:dihydrolipoyllysine-residue acetyltransferase [Pistricoccus aurantiacus]|uniref:Dihydrolipoamide acetyltransferase component of pyruvate dehydrogenase complex n=1 Tax=Pistricoccus aurantiacus TaxID=1883414 RepID=A0A5B8SYF4_9GAMM|nr:2-oxo acid dehydrogenase subunit E2 [Pistricoccus aurantiacus]QEA39868.1 dihydrolipoyllysine-residue acetyltransferase [Pistricoccus aurantiacus]
MSDFILPDIGEGIVECELVKWLVAEGDVIEEDQPVAEVMTDKALVEIPAPYKGQITKLYYQEGEVAKVHAPLFALVEEGESSSEESAGSPAKAADQRDDEPRESSAGITSKTAADEGSSPALSSHKPEEPEVDQGSDPAHGRIPASPAVRRLVRELDARLEDIPGSGKDGRVLKEDVLAWQEGAESGAARKSRQPDTEPAAKKASDEVRIEPIKGIRAVMAKRMALAASSIPHFSYGDEIDITELLALRQRLKPQAEARELRLTLMPFFMKAMALAVKDFPILNSRVSEDVSEIHYQPSCNIGMAVDSQNGLLVPNIKGVENLSILEIAAEVARLTQAAREGRVAQQDLQAGTISLSNIGALGGTYASPIINAPEVAIVAIGKTQQLPRFDALGQVVSRAILTATWAGDHRIIDGGTIARFGNRWKGFLEAPESMLLELK